MSEVLAELSLQYASLIVESPTVKNHVSDQVNKWQSKTRSHLKENFPFALQEKQLKEWGRQFQFAPASKINLIKTIDEYIIFCKKAKLPVNEIFWRKQVENTLETQSRDSQEKNKTVLQNIKISTQLLLQQWDKEIEKLRSEWEFAQINALRADLLTKLDALLHLLQQLHEQLKILGLDPGLLLDLSKGNLTAQDINNFQRWTKYLSEDQGVRALCDLLGKVRQIDLSGRIERVTVTQSRSVRLPDINSREEIIGLRLGCDLEHALPSEIALLANPETAILFDLKYVESRLVCFDMQGIQTQLENFEIEENHHINEQEKKGPMVICVDTSGSMSGMPETISKAVTLFMASKAKEQKRACYLINFSTNIHTLDLTNNFGMTSLLNFLKMSFHGGTDVAPALTHALSVMEKDDYKKADLLIISDFIMRELPENLLNKIQHQRISGNKFYSLIVGSCYMSHRLNNFFDQEWVYNPQNSAIHELVSFQQRVNADMH